MDATTRSRRQFAATTIHHILLLPLSIGRTMLAATARTAEDSAQETLGRLAP